ncbi:MAG: DUF805 domain-containing protein [Bacteroidota bacterium]
MLALNNSFQFKGRSRRAEFWSFVLVTMIFSAVAGFWDNALFNGNEYLENLLEIAFFIPSIAVSTRRLHDVGRSGWWQLIAFTGIGVFVLLYWYIKDSDHDDNEYGSSPKYGYVNTDQDGGAFSEKDIV